MKRHTSSKSRPLEVVGDFLFRKLFIFLLLGGISSAIYGWREQAWISFCFIILFLMMACVMIFLLALNDRTEDLRRQFMWLVRNLPDESLKKQFKEKFSKEEGNEEDDEV